MLRSSQHYTLLALKRHLKWPFLRYSEIGARGGTPCICSRRSLRRRRRASPPHHCHYANKNKTGIGWWGGKEE